MDTDASVTVATGWGALDIFVLVLYVRVWAHIIKKDIASQSNHVERCVNSVLGHGSMYMSILRLKVMREVWSRGIPNLRQHRLHCTKKREGW